VSLASRTDGLPRVVEAEWTSIPVALDCCRYGPSRFRYFSQNPGLSWGKERAGSDLRKPTKSFTDDVSGICAGEGKMCVAAEKGDSGGSGQSL
jgi:hypothetical protein